MQTTTTAARPMLEVHAQHIAALRRVINPSAYRKLPQGHPELMVDVTPADREFALGKLLEDAERVGLWIGGERGDFHVEQPSKYFGLISSDALIALGLSGKADPEQCAAIWAELGARFQRDHNGELAKRAREVAEVAAGVR